jgi:hypothetical protein
MTYLDTKRTFTVSRQEATLSQDRYRAALAGIDNLITLIAIPER